MWNAQHDWVTLRHVLGSVAAPRDAASGIHWLGPLVYLGATVRLLLVFWFVAWVAAMIGPSPAGESRPRRALPVVAVGADVPGVPGLFSFKTGGGELNWPVTAYLSGLVLAAAWLDDSSVSGAGLAVRTNSTWG